MATEMTKMLQLVIGSVCAFLWAAWSIMNYAQWMYDINETEGNVEESNILADGNHAIE